MLVSKDVRNSQIQSSGSDLTARQVLDGRLARGEISVDEFERIRARLDD